MVLFLGFVLFRLLKYIVIVVGFLTYVEVGPGGEYIWNFACVVRDELIKVNWQNIFSEAKNAGVHVLNDFTAYLNVKGDE